MSSSPSGDALLVNTGEEIQIWPNPPHLSSRPETLFRRANEVLYGTAVAWGAKRLCVASGDGGVWLASMDGKAARKLEGFTGVVGTCVLDPAGRYVAAAGDPVYKESYPIVWDLDTGEVHRLNLIDGLQSKPIMFTPAGELLVVGGERLFKCNLEDLSW